VGKADGNKSLWRPQRWWDNVNCIHMRTGKSVGIFWTRKQTFGFHKIPLISRLAEQVSDSEEGLGSSLAVFDFIDLLYFCNCTNPTAKHYVFWKGPYVQQNYRQKFPIIVHDNLQRESHKPYVYPTSVTWLHLLRKQMNTSTSTVLIAETHWSTRTRLRALPRLVTTA
jgi:hypothetical protein